MLHRSLTIIVPVYNEELCLEKFREKMEAFLSKSPADTKVLFVNDGSTDQSEILLASICKDPLYSFISLDKNHGLSTALKAGFDQVETELVGYIDSDLQMDPLDFLNFLPHMTEYDMVNGIRADRNDSLVKRWSSKFGNGVKRILVKDGIVDTCCPLKLMHTDMLRQLPFFKGMHRFIPTLFILYGGRVKQIPVKHNNRYAGKSKYNFWNRLTGPFLDTLGFYWLKKRKINYKISPQKSSSPSPVEKIQSHL